MRRRPTDLPEPHPSRTIAGKAEKVAPIKFDTRPLVMPTRVPQNDDDADGDRRLRESAGGSAQCETVHRAPRRAVHEQGAVGALRSHTAELEARSDGRGRPHRAAHEGRGGQFPDPNDRATQEEEFSLELRTRDRERKLIRKIDEALKRIEDGSYGYCLETGEEIGIKRLEARPVATLSVEAQERRERREKQYGDRDDRYR